MDATDSNLENYQGKDIRFEKDSGSYTNTDNKPSNYVFVSSDQRKTYFASDGRLLGIKDRFGNEIKFTHINRVINGSTYPFISKIVDSIGRTLDFTYVSAYPNPADTTTNMEDIKILVKDPNNTNNLTITYNKFLAKITNTNINTGQVVDSREEPVLRSVTNPVGQKTGFEYNDFDGIRFNFESKSLTTSSKSVVFLLTGVIYPSSKTNYDYYKGSEIAIRNLGPDGASYGYRVKSRFDQDLRYDENITPSPFYFTGSNNRIDYSYIGDYTGYPTYRFDEAIPKTNAFQFSSESVTSNGMRVKNVFNGAKQQIQTDIVSSNGEKKIIQNTSFDNRFTQKPINSVVTDYSSSGVAGLSLYSSRSYNDWGGVASVSQLLPASKYNDALLFPKYNVTYIYNPTFKMLEERTWYQNESDSTPSKETFSFDALGRIFTEKNAAGEITNYTYTTDVNGDPNVEISKLLENNKTAKTIKIYGASAKFAYPTIIKKYYTDVNNVVKETKTSSTYNLLLGLISSETSDTNLTTSYVYDNLGRVTYIKPPDYRDQQNQGYTTQQYFDYTPVIFGHPDPILDKLILTQARSYTTVIRNNNVNDGHVYTYNIDYYNGYGSLLDQFSNVIPNAVNDLSFVEQKRHHYDPMQRPIYTRDAEGNETSYAYDSWGNLSESVDPFNNLNRTDYDFIGRTSKSYFVASSNLSAFRSIPADNLKENVSMKAVNEFGKMMTTSVFPNWPSTSGSIQQQYTYDIIGNLKGHTDGKNYTTSYGYDSLNRLVQVLNPENETTNYEYSKLGDLTQVKQLVNGQLITTRTNEYNELGNLRKKFDPLSPAEEYVPNSLGNLINATDSNGTQFSNTYDEINRLTLRNGGGIQLRDYYEHNPFGPVKQEQYTNNILNNSIEWDYNAFGMPQTKKSAGAQITNSYDNTNKITDIALNLQGDFHTRYQYDKTRLSQVQTNGSAVQSLSDTVNAKYDYYPNGALKAITYPRLNDGTFLQTQYMYDKLNRLQVMKNVKASVTLSEFTYTYDNNGNIWTQTETGKGTSTYDYDKLNRLKEIVRPDLSKVTYTYDARGNRETMEDTSSFLHNQIAGTYAYDALNRLSQVTKGTSTASFEYDASSLRSKKVTPTETMQYHYNISDEVVAETDAANNVKSQYIWGPDRLLVKKDKSSGTEQTYYYVYNGHGDVIQMVDTNGNVKNSYQYDEWGNILNQTETVKNSFKYAGEQLDDETGLYYLKARYYDPSIGRFINKDTYEGDISNPVTLNLFTYANNNPMMYIDPTGHMGWLQTGDLISGLLQSVGSALKDLLSSPLALYQTGKALINGSLSLTDLGKAIGSSVIDPIAYLVKNSAHVWGGKPTDAEVKEYGVQLGTVLQMALGSEAAIGVLSKAIPLLGKILKAVEKVDGCNCFTAGTKVLTDEGEKPIEEIEVGDRVLSKDDITGEEAYKEVTDTFNHVADAIYKIHVGDQLIESTFNHPFWVDGKGWTFVKDLQVGDLLVQSDGNKIRIDSIEFEQKQAIVYNMTVDDFHTYFVSDLGIWVHNTKCPLAPSGSYTIEFENDMKYHGKGDISRANQSAKEKSDKYGTPVKADGIDWTPSANSRQGFIDEYQRMKSDGGYKSSTNYNQRNSPGANYYYQQYGYY